MSNNIEDKVVVIIGASSGLGERPHGFFPVKARASYSGNQHADQRHFGAAELIRSRAGSVVIVQPGFP